MYVDEAINVVELLGSEEFLTVGKVVDFGAENVGIERLEQLKGDVF